MIIRSITPLDHEENYTRTKYVEINKDILVFLALVFLSLWVLVQSSWLLIDFDVLRHVWRRDYCCGSFSVVRWINSELETSQNLEHLKT